MLFVYKLKRKLLNTSRRDLL